MSGSRDRSLEFFHADPEVRGDPQREKTESDRDLPPGEDHQHADRIMVIDDGKIKAEGLREDVLPCLNGLDKCHTCAGKAGVRA